MPLDGKANLNVCCGLLGQQFGAWQSRCHRCDTGVTKTRTEAPSLKSQCGNLTGKFLFLLFQELSGKMHGNSLVFSVE